jgi:cyclopropane-fatty-acyl-phospholipid synthase
MGKTGAQATIQALLAQAGVTINGDQAWDIQVHNKDLYSRLLSGGTLAMGESYMDGWWDCESLDQFICKVLGANLDKKVKGNYRLAWHVLKAKFFNLQKPNRAYQVGEEHYEPAATGQLSTIWMQPRRPNWTSCVARSTWNRE